MFSRLGGSRQCVRSIAAVGDGVRKQFDHLEELDDGPRPAMHEQQRHGRRFGRTDMQEMDVGIVGGRHGLGKRVELYLEPTPNQVVSPVGGQVQQVVERNALRPSPIRRQVRAQFRNRVRPTRARQPGKRTRGRPVLSGPTRRSSKS